MSDPVILWFRQDLRLSDNPALQWALHTGQPILPVFIWAPEEEAPWSPGGASQWWLHQSLQALDADLQARGSRLIIQTGPVVETLQRLVAEHAASRLCYNRRYEPWARRQEALVKAALGSSVTIQAANGSLLFAPALVLNKSERPFQVFSAFWRSCVALGEPEAPMRAPDRLPAPPQWPPSLPLEALKLEPTIPWAAEMAATWQPGESGAALKLAQFTEKALGAYDTGRDRPALAGVSQLSPYLHFGEISPRQIWHAVRQAARQSSSQHPGGQKSIETYLREIGWREFAYHLLYHFPHTPESCLREEFNAFPWLQDADRLRAWQRGQTGYPLVDAGMRQLWRTGWMHNRVRMVVGSFLVKHLLLPWQDGAAWFWDTLLDADLASNTLGWQWVAGCGADAAPYFRVFNPILQGEKFDPDGLYVRRWVPELGKVPSQWIHRPWEAPPLLLAEAGVTLGHTYPHPLVDHGEARQNALAALATIRKDKTPPA